MRRTSWSLISTLTLFSLWRANIQRWWWIPFTSSPKTWQVLWCFTHVFLHLSQVHFNCLPWATWGISKTDILRPKQSETSSRNAFLMYDGMPRHHIYQYAHARPWPWSPKWYWEVCRENGQDREDSDPYGEEEVQTQRALHRWKFEINWRAKVNFWISCTVALRTSLQRHCANLGDHD